MLVIQNMIERIIMVMNMLLLVMYAHDLNGGGGFFCSDMEERRKYR
jgi:hypothetical protein